MAGQQVQDALALTLEALESFRWAARGSWLSQEEYRTKAMPSAESFEETPSGRKLQEVYLELSEMQKKLRPYITAAAYDPRGI